MKRKATENQIVFETKPPRFVLFVERLDGSYNVYEDTEKELRAYRPRKGERTSLHRAYVRREP